MPLRASNRFPITAIKRVDEKYSKKSIFSIYGSTEPSNLGAESNNQIKQQLFFPLMQKDYLQKLNNGNNNIQQLFPEQLLPGQKDSMSAPNDRFSHENKNRRSPSNGNQIPDHTSS